jgi:hypothetical protein
MNKDLYNKFIVLLTSRLLQTNTWVDNSGDMDNFDLEPSNVQMELSG